MNIIVQEIKSFFKNGSVLSKLLAVNILVFLPFGITFTILSLFKLNTSWYQLAISWLVVPSGLSKLVTQPWSIFTHMFLHVDFFHLVFNCIYLYWAGTLFNSFIGEKRLLGVYLLSGLSGAFLFILFYNVFPLFTSISDHSFALGASACALGVLTAIATHSPNYQINLLMVGPVRLKWIALFFLLLDFTSIPSSNAGGHIAHIGGAAFGYLYSIRLRKGQDLSILLQKLTNWFNQLFKPKSHLKVKHKSTNPTQKNKRTQSQQQVIDEILDKISKSGYDSLTKDEKDILFNLTKNE